MEKLLVQGYAFDAFAESSMTENESISKLKILKRVYLIAQEYLARASGQ